MADDIGFEEARALTLGASAPLQPITLPVEEAEGMVAVNSVSALVDCPAADISLMDGHAVISSDLAAAERERPVLLAVTGTVCAGGKLKGAVRHGTAIKVMTGARIPEGADAVIPVELTEEQGDRILCLERVEPGCHVLKRGSDVQSGRQVLKQGETISPAVAGLLAAAGHSSVDLYARPRVGLIAAGDEVVTPGRRLKAGQVYASGLVTILSWLRRFRMEGDAMIVRDDEADIRAAVDSMLSQSDAVVTSGGAWKSERDLTVGVLTKMGWQPLFRRVRMAPGKSVAVGLLQGTPVFCLPGRPTAAEAAFLHLALPGLLKTAGLAPDPFPQKSVRLSSSIAGRTEWTRFVQTELRQVDGHTWAEPLRGGSRLQARARARAIVKIPEGVERIGKGEEVEAQILFPCMAHPV